MNKQKRILYWILTILFITCSCGCTQKNASFSQDEIVAIFNEKYGDSFTFLSSGSELWNADHNEVILKSSSLDQEVTVWIYEDGSMVDNYMALKYKSDVEAFVCPLAREIYGESKVVNIPIHYGKEHFDSTLDLTAYVSNKKSGLSIAIATNKDSAYAEEDAQAFVQALKENRIAANFRIFYYDMANLSEINETEPNQIFDTEPKEMLKVLVNADFTIDSMNWTTY